MPTAKYKPEDAKQLKKLGQHVEKLIQERGYENGYQYWIHVAGDDISRDTLHRIINGKDTKVTSLFTLARLLKIKPSQLLDF